MTDEFRAAVSVSEMAKIVGMSRSRFYQLMGTTFPRPTYDDESGKPYYTAEQQRACLEVRRTNQGVDGKPALFYLRRKSTEASKPAREKKKAKSNDDHADLIESLKALGLETTTVQVRETMEELYPDGSRDQDEADVIRAIFLYLQGKR